MPGIQVSGVAGSWGLQGCEIGLQHHFCESPTEIIILFGEPVDIVIQYLWSNTMLHSVLNRDHSGCCVVPLQNFRANPYFEDAKLTKIFKFSDEGTTSVSGTQPKWRAGMVRVLGFSVSLSICVSVRCCRGIWNCGVVSYWVLFSGQDLTNGVLPEKEGNKRPLVEERYTPWKHTWSDFGPWNVYVRPTVIVVLLIFSCWIYPCNRYRLGCECFSYNRGVYCCAASSSGSLTLSRKCL